MYLPSILSSLQDKAAWKPVLAFKKHKVRRDARAAIDDLNLTLSIPENQRDVPVSA